MLEMVNFGDQPAPVGISLESLKRKPGMKGSYLGNIVSGQTNEAGSDIVLATLEELIKAESAKYVPVPEASKAGPASLPPHRSIQWRAAANGTGDYLLKYRVTQGAQVLAGGVCPFVLVPPVQMTLTPYYLSPGVVSLKVDLDKMKEWVKGAKARFTIVKKAGDKELARVDRTCAGERELTVALPTRDLPAGGYLAVLELFGADGKSFGSLNTGFQKPPNPVWFDKPVGLAPVIPYPWKPIRMEGQRISFLMADYQLEGVGFPAQVNVRNIFQEKRDPILGAPIALTGSINGKPIAWSAGAARVVKQGDDLVELAGEAACEGLAIRVRTEFEYDGMAKVTLTLAPEKDHKPAIDRLSLEFPVKKEFAALYCRAPALMEFGNFMMAGAVPKEGLKHPFVYSVWLGDEERGFRWFSENMKGWRLGEKFRAEAIEVIPSGANTLLRVNMIREEKPFVLDKEREIVFGYMNTPTRTAVPRLFHHGYVSNTYKVDLPAAEGCFENSTEPWYFSWTLPDNSAQNWGWPVLPPLPKGAVATEGLSTLSEAQNITAMLQKYGRRVAPYSGWHLPMSSQEYKQYGDELTTTPEGGVGCGSVMGCWNTAVQDAFTGLMSDRINDLHIDGFRMDAGFSAERCINPLHSGYGSICGWYDDDGKLQPSRPLFATRKAAQRMYRLFHDGQRKDEDCDCQHHIHQGNRYDFILDHMDGVHSSEGQEIKISTAKELSLEFYRACNMGDAHGWQVIYFPKTDALGMDFRYGLALLHDMQPRGSTGLFKNLDRSYSRCTEDVTPIWAAQEWIGSPFQQGTEIWGYWKNAAYLNTGSPDVKGTFYVQRGKKLLLALLTQERRPIATDVRLDFKALGFDGKVYGYDSIARTEIKVEGDKFPVTLTPEGFRMIMFSAKPFDAFVPEPVGENLIPECAPDRWPKMGAPAGWTAVMGVGGRKGKMSPATAKEVGVENGAIVLTGDGKNSINLERPLVVTPGKSYMLEAELSIQCDDVVFSQNVFQSYLKISLGEIYVKDQCTFTAQTVPGRTETVRLCFTPKDNAKVQVFLEKAKAKVSIKKLALYELKQPPRLPWIAENGGSI